MEWQSLTNDIVRENLGKLEMSSSVPLASEKFQSFIPIDSKQEMQKMVQQLSKYTLLVHRSVTSASHRMNLFDSLSKVIQLTLLNQLDSLSGIDGDVRIVRFNLLFGRQYRSAEACVKRWNSKRWSGRCEGGV